MSWWLKGTGFMSLIDDFKAFIGGGNVMDLAVGLIIGGAMSGILKSFVDEMIIPFTGLLGKVSWADSYLPLRTTDAFKEGMSLKAARDSGASVLGWGQFMTTAVNTLLLAFAVFMIVKALNKMKLAKLSEAPPPPAQEVLLGEIRDLLKKQA
jgi:large conductance mechanosensitive channel